MAATKLPAGSKGADYHRQCTGAALKTAQAHSQLPSNGLSLFGAAFCPFVHRVWIALEYVKAPYRYVEVDPYQKPQELLDINPRGLVPGIRLEDVNGQVRGLGESTVILEYINELFVESQDTTQTRMLPPMNSESNVYLRAKTRLVAHHLNAKLIPAFYRFLQAQDTDKQVQFGQEFVEELKSFQDELEAADPTEKSAAGPFFGGSEELTLVDISIAPWCFRATNVLKHFRALDLTSALPSGSRYQKWASAVFDHPAFKATTSTEDLYLDSYARYAENRPNTSQVATAINAGRSLP